MSRRNRPRSSERPASLEREPGAAGLCPVLQIGLCSAMVAMLLGPGLPISAAESSWKTGTAFERALEQPVSLLKEHTELRELLRDLSHTQQIACLLDRRVDPSLPVSLSAAQTPLRQIVEELGRQAGITSGELGATLVLGRYVELDRLLSEAEFQKERLRTLQSIPAARRLQLVRRQQVTWEDLDRPHDVLQTIAGRWGLLITNPEQVPHDLWAHGTAAGLDAVEALTLILGQFELTFDWCDAGSAIEILPAPPTRQFPSLHRPQGITPQAAITRLQERWPEIEVTRRGPSLQVTASVLQHAEITRMLGKEHSPVAPGNPPPLSRRTFPKVRVVRTPLKDLLAALQQQGIDIEYDADRLRTAGIDLERLVSLDLQNVTTEELFNAVCRPSGLKFEMRESQVILSPAEARP